MQAMKRAAMALVLPLFVLACQDEMTAPGGLSDLPAELQGLEAGIHPVLSIPGLAQAGAGQLLEINLHFREVDVDQPVSSYQGEFIFDPGALKIVEGSFPDGLLGAWNEVEPGRIRFAGVKLDGLGEGVALTLLVETQRALSPGDFRIDMEEIVASEGFTDITDRVVRRDAPILTSARLGETVRR